MFVAATFNNIAKLPPELLRRGRFDKIYFVDFPDISERQEILKILLSKYKLEISEEKITTIAEKLPNYSGADIEYIIKEIRREHNEENLTEDSILRYFIEKIEINARCRIGNYVSEHYGVLGYKDKDNFVDEEYHKQFMSDINEEIRRNLRAPFVKNFTENYEGRDLHMYALVEICSFGTLSKFFKNMKNSDKKAIAKSFGIGYTYYESWIESISYVRNICAHYGRIYNAKLAKKPILYNQYTEAGIDNNRIFAVLLCISHIIEKDAHWIGFLEDVEKLIDKYSNIEIGSMGFPEDWKTYLYPQQSKDDE